MNPKLTAQHRKIIVLATLLGGAIVAFSLRGRIDISDVQQWMENAGSIGWIMFILIYALATILLLPGSLITIAGGLVYGPLLGTLLSLMGATLGASGAFILARHSSSSWVEQRMGEKMRQLIKGIDKEGWRFVAWVRLVPLFPFVLVNYALGLTRIPLLSYTITSFIFMLPGTAVYTLIGHAGGTALSGQALAEQMRWLLIALAAFATLLFIPSLLRHWRKQS